MKQTLGIQLERMLPGLVSVITTLSLCAQPKEESTFSLSPGDVTEATIDTAGRTRLLLTLTPDKRAEFSSFTGRNLNKQVKIVSPASCSPNRSSGNRSQVPRWKFTSAHARMRWPRSKRC